jgi:hypothetical protein
MKLPNSLSAIMLLSVLITAFSCSKESFCPPSAGDLELTAPSEGQRPQVTIVDSSDVVIDGPGRIDIVDPDSTEDDDPTPPTGPPPEAVLDSLRVAYRTRNLDLFAELLAPGFRYYLVDSGSEVFPSPTDDYRNREQEIATHRNMLDLNFKPRAPLRNLESIAVSFTLLSKEQYRDPRGNGWRLHCRAVWNLWNNQMAPKPFGIRHEGRFSLDVRPDPSGDGQWLIETWREEIGETHFIYRP